MTPVARSPGPQPRRGQRPGLIPQEWPRCWPRRPRPQRPGEHNTPYDQGSRTCLCNADLKCRHDHKLKQHPRWQVDQLPDGTFRWTTPSGRQYTTEPTRYPI